MDRDRELPGFSFSKPSLPMYWVEAKRSKLNRDRELRHELTEEVHIAKPSQSSEVCETSNRISNNSKEEAVTVALDRQDFRT